jgi:hypothetical protein
MDDQLIDDERRVALNVASRNSEMMAAIYENNPKRLAKAIQDGADPNARLDEDNIGTIPPSWVGNTALILAFVCSRRLIDSKIKRDLLAGSYETVDRMAVCCKNLDSKGFQGCANKTHDCANMLVANTRVDLYATWQPSDSPEGATVYTAMAIALGGAHSEDTETGKDLWLTVALVRNALRGDPRQKIVGLPYGPSQMQSIMRDENDRGKIGRKLIEALAKGNSPVTQARRSEWLVSLPRPPSQFKIPFR